MNRVGPLAALAVVAAVDVLAFAATGPFLLVALALALALAASSGTMRPVRRGFAAGAPMIVLTLLLDALLIPGEAFATAGPFALTLEGLSVGVALSARLLVLLLAALWAVEVVAPRDLLDLAARLRWPTLGMTARAAGTLAADARRIREAQTMRGLGAHGIATYRAYLVPLFVVALRRAQTSGRALALAGLGEPGRSHLRPFPWHRADGAWTAAALLVLAFAIALYGGLV